MSVCKNEADPLCKGCGKCSSDYKSTLRESYGECGELLNEHGKYLVRFARNHGLSIADAHNKPMIKAHYAAMQYLNSDEYRNRFINYAN